MKLKRILMFGGMAIAMSGLFSCSSIKHTSTSVPVVTTVLSENTAELDVSMNKVSYTLYPEKNIRKLGTKNVINTAVKEALKENGNADVLVGMEYEMKRGGISGKKIRYVKVTGYPAKYKNIQPVK